MKTLASHAAARETDGMYERFTERSRRVMQLANQEAQRLQCEYIGSEHVLVGLIDEGKGFAAIVLKQLGITADKVRAEIARLIENDPAAGASEPPRAKKVIEHAFDEAAKLRHQYVGTEHLLLGLVREENNLAVDALTNLGVKPTQLRDEILNSLGHGLTELQTGEPVEIGADDLPTALQAAGAALDADIARFKSESTIAVAQNQFQKAAALRDRADHLWRTKAAMVRYWIMHRPVGTSWTAGMAIKVARCPLGARSR